MTEVKAQEPEQPKIAPESQISAVDQPTDSKEMVTQTGAEALNVLKLPVNATFEELAERIPEVRAMVGFDQRSDFHSLTLDEHTKQVVKGLLANPFVAEHAKRDLIVLAGNLHDLGKTAPDGQQIHPKEANKRQYVGHEKASERMVGEILPRDIVDLSPEDREFVIGLVALHASALQMVGNFGKNNQPKGSELGSYDDFIAKVEKIPGELSLEEKMRIIFAFNKADKMGGYNDGSDRNDPKVAGIIEKSVKQVEDLDELEKALPAIIEAVKAKRAGVSTAAVVLEGGKYKYSEGLRTVVETAMDKAQIGIVMQNAIKLGVPKERTGELGKVLREKGLAGLEEAGFGANIDAINKLLAK